MLNKVSAFFDFSLLLLSMITLLFWLNGSGLFYSDTSPVFSPFTAISLFLLTLTRVNRKHFSTWSSPMSLALLGIVGCGNLSSLFVHWISPDLFLKTMPSLVPTSALTSFGIIMFCLYEALISLRETPRSVFIGDDILLHLALFPGGLSLLGYFLGVEAYTSSSVDPRVGVGLFEMMIMAIYATSAVLSNDQLYLWIFLKKRPINRLIFLILVGNQFFTPFWVGYFFRNPALSPQSFGLEFYVMMAGVLATLIFLSGSALIYEKNHRNKKLSTM